MFNILKFIPDKEHLPTALIYCFHLKKTLLNNIDYFKKLMGIMLHRRIHVNIVFDQSLCQKDDALCFVGPEGYGVL